MFTLDRMECLQWFFQQQNVVELLISDLVWSSSVSDINKHSTQASHEYSLNIKSECQLVLRNDLQPTRFCDIHARKEVKHPVVTFSAVQYFGQIRNWIVKNECISNWISSRSLYTLQHQHGTVTHKNEGLLIVLNKICTHQKEELMQQLLGSKDPEDCGVGIAEGWNQWMAFAIWPISAECQNHHALCT